VYVRINPESKKNKLTADGPASLLVNKGRGAKWLHSTMDAAKKRSPVSAGRDVGLMASVTSSGIVVHLPVVGTLSGGQYRAHPVIT
jgi:hypothetical protein